MSSSEFELVGLALVLFSAIPLIVSQLIRRKTMRISIAASVDAEKHPEIVSRGQSGGLIVAVWTSMMIIHIALIELGAYVGLGFQGLLTMLFYTGPLVPISLGEVSKMRMEPLDRIEHSLEESRSVHGNRIQILTRIVEHSVRTSTHTDIERKALIYHLAERNDIIGRIAMEMQNIP
ncbi:MAG: hypothetical protein P1Q69_11240 [Candidatus Thorarchaeota archaeon]|nr:hypothetical protein [Candidatus Thorarchaeota archaeon]